MNLDERYHCAAHPEITVGATPGETEPPRCPICRKPMTTLDDLVSSMKAGW